MIGRSPRGTRLNAFETQLEQGQLIDEGIDKPDWIVLVDVIVEAFRKQSALTSIFTFNESLHTTSRHNEVVRLTYRPFSHTLGHERSA
jgi:hypothetical protein